MSETSNLENISKVLLVSSGLLVGFVGYKSFLTYTRVSQNVSHNRSLSVVLEEIYAAEEKERLKKKQSLYAKFVGALWGLMSVDRSQEFETLSRAIGSATGIDKDVNSNARNDNIMRCKY